MELSPIVPGDRQLIAGYGPGLFRVSGEVYNTSILVFPDRTLQWPVSSVDALAQDSFDAVLGNDPPVEILLLGAGSRNRLVPETFRAALRKERIVLDVMDTGAACRTYNVLMAEDRRVAAALVLLD